MQSDFFSHAERVRLPASGPRFFLSRCCLVSSVLPCCRPGLCPSGGTFSGLGPRVAVGEGLRESVHVSTSKKPLSPIRREEGGVLGQPNRQWLELVPCFALG